MNPLEDDDPLSRRGFLVGTAGAAAAAGMSATALAQEDDGDDEDENGEEENGEEENGEEEDGEEENGEEENGEEGEEGEDGDGGGGTETVEVGDDYFEPEELIVEPGTTVVWEWVGDRDHNIAPGSQPEEADWDGHTDLQSDGEYEFTFDVEGTYEYVCEPHVGVGMVGSVIVDPDGGGGGAAGPAELVPDAAWTLVIATVAGMVSTLSLVYFFMRYGGESQ